MIKAEDVNLPGLVLLWDIGMRTPVFFGKQKDE